MVYRLGWSRLIGAAGVLAGVGCGPQSSSVPASHADAATGDGAGPSTGDAATLADADGGGCHPGAVAGLPMPSVFPFPLGPPSTVCSDYGDAGLVSSYGDACLGGAATYETCAAFPAPDGGAVAACYACLTTPASADASFYGVVVSGALAIVNYGACVLALDPSDAGRSCALANLAAAECADDACKANCPVTDNASLDAYSACTNAAVYGTCLGYALEAAACLAAERGDGGTPVASICFAGSSAEDHYRSMAQFFCGGG